MNNYFNEQGRTLLTNGYLIIPIKPGQKRPALDHWQMARLGASDLERYPSHGVGVLTGQGAHPVCAVDIDSTHEDLVTEFVEWCVKNLGITCERIGKAPKTLLVYRAQIEGWGKATGKMYKDAEGVNHRLEILGKGQQFVAYHIHPDTQKPYEWVDFYGGIEEMRANELPVVTEEQIIEAMTVFDRMAVEHGLVLAKGSTVKVGAVTSNISDADDPFAAFEPPIDIDRTQVEHLLQFVDNEDYDTWLKVGMSLHHQFEQSDEGLELWNTWSKGATNYGSPDDLAARWASFGRSGRNPVTAKWLLKIGRSGEREVKREEKRDALAEARELIAECEDSIELINEVARKVGDAAGDDIALKAELAGLVRARFKSLTNTNLTVSEVRTAMGTGRKLEAFNKQKRQLTEFGNAERMLDNYGAGLMFVPELDAWFKWTGIFWRRSYRVELSHMAVETIKALPDELKTMESDTERSAFFMFCYESQKATMVKNMVTLAQASPRVFVPASELDKARHLLGVANGVVDLRTGKLLAPDPAQRVTLITSAEYEASARAPVFEQTVSDVFYGDSEAISFFKRLIGYSLLGNPTEDILAIPYGSGSNGKSTVLGAIRDVLGDHAKTASSETFLGKSGTSSGGGPREDLVRLRGARFVYVTEPDEGGELKEGMVKAVTGGDKITARGVLATSSIEITPTWVVFMPTNHKPIVKGDDNGIWRRLLLIPFVRNFKADKSVKEDLDRADKLAREKKGILRWCVEGALEYQAEGLNKTEKIQAAIKEYREDMDILAEWVLCCLEPDDGKKARVSVNQCWASWQDFARGRGELMYINNQRKLSNRLASRFSMSKIGGVNFVLGMKIKNSDEFN